MPARYGRHGRSAAHEADGWAWVLVEPGPYDEKNGIGINPSDNLLISKKGGVLLSSVPYSKEWGFLKI